MTAATVPPDDQVPEAQIAVHWREEEYVQPPAKFIGQANASDPAIFERFSEDKFPECFRDYADLLSWDTYWHTTLDTSNPPFWNWFAGGRLNACTNCVDRHLATSANKAALIWGRAQPVIATSSASFSDGFMNPSVSRGRLLRLAVNRARSSALWSERSVPFGMY